MLRVRLFPLLVAVVLGFLSHHGAVQSRSSASSRWITSWTAMPQLTEPGNLPPPPFNATPAIFPNSTIRQTIHVSLTGDTHRLRVSNVFGTTPLALNSVSLHLPINNSAGTSSIISSSTRKLTFSGSSSYLIPPGAYIISDPITLPLRSATNLSISIYLSSGLSGGVTGHPGSRTTSWLTFGDATSASAFTTNSTSTASTAHWYLISSLETLSAPQTSAVAIVGDSITDGRGSTTDANNRWPDILLSRLLSRRPAVAVLNQAAGGNRILADGLGPAALTRIDRDVLAQSGVKYVLVFEGVNDIGTTATDVASQKDVGDRLIAAYKQIILRSHAVGLPVFGATITPFSAPAGSTVQAYSDPEREKTRARVNAWIKARGSGGFDAVVDFDKVVANGTMLKAEYDSGDYLHLNPEGYKAIGNVVDLGLFGRFEGGVYG